MSSSTRPRPSEDGRALRCNPRTHSSPATALFELARQTHEKEALLKLAKALQNRLDSLGARLAVLDTRAEQLRAFTGFRCVSRRLGSGKAMVSGVRDRRFRPSSTGNVADRPRPAGVKVIRWKL